MSTIADVDASIENGYQSFCREMALGNDTPWNRMAFYMTSIQILSDEPFEDPLLQHLFMTRLEHQRTLALATIIYNVFFRKIK